MPASCSEGAAAMARATAIASCWLRLTRTAGTPGRLVQVKGIRMAPVKPGQDGQAMYRNKPKYGFSLMLGPDLQARDNAIYHWASEDVTERVSKHENPPQSYDDVWVSWEAYYRFNDLGQKNGVQEVTLGGRTVAAITDHAVRTQANEYLGFVQFTPGITNGSAGADWQVRLSRCYIDTTRARIWLGNAATADACTGRFLIRPTAWSDGAISATVERRPKGYDWVYLCTADGAMSGSGAAQPAIHGWSGPGRARIVDGRGMVAEHQTQEILGDCFVPGSFNWRCHWVGFVLWKL